MNKASDSAVQSENQAKFDRWSQAVREAKKKKRINFLIFLLLIPGTAILTVYIFLWHSSNNLGLLLLFGVPIASFIVCSRLNKAVWRELENNPAVTDFTDTMMGMHEELLGEAFGTPVQVQRDLACTPDGFEPYMPEHLFGLKERNWTYALLCCTQIPYRDGSVRLCSFQAVEPGDDDGPGITLKGLYLAVHTPGKISIPHDPLHITRLRIPASENGETGKFHAYYKGTRKIGPLGHRQEVDSVPAISAEVGNAIMNFEERSSRHKVQEAWIVGRGRYYFRMSGPMQLQVYSDEYVTTAGNYRELYGRIRKLADACFDMTAADSRISGLE